MKTKFAVASLILAFLFSTQLYAQTPWYITGNSGIVASNFIGSTNNAPLKFRTANKQRMIIRHSGPANFWGPTDGFVGIGTSFSFPDFLLDVKGGDINVKTPSNAYRLGDSIFVRHKGAVSNVYVGVGANEAGGVGGDNTFVGYHAGQNFQFGLNTFIGAYAGESCTTGDENTFVGWKAGVNHTTGVHNVYIGQGSGWLSTTAHNNTFVGITAGFNNVSGIDNVGLGAGAGPTSGALNNTGAIGAGAQVTQNDQIIIGNSLQTVGIGLSADPTGPQNWLEINTPATSSVPGASGLRFRDLTSASTASTNPGTGVLSVDGNGDVIYVTPGTSTSGGFGNSCLTPAANPLTMNWEANLDNYNLMFNESTLSTNTTESEIGFGYPNGSCVNTYNGKFEVFSRNGFHKFAGHFLNFDLTAGSQDAYGLNGTAWSQNNNAIGVTGVAKMAINTGYGIGVSGISTDLFPAFNYGVHGEASQGNRWSIGGEFEATVNPATSTSIVNAGVVGSINSPSGLGAFTTTTNIGVYGYNPNLSGGPSSDWAGYFDGDVNINGTGYITAGVWSTSDKRYKQQIKPLEGVMDKISKLNGYTYTYKTEEFPAKGFDSRSHIGLIAQELKEVFPELVREDAKGYYAVNYEGMIPVLLDAVKNQQKQIDELKALVASTSNPQQGNNNNSEFEKSIELGNTESIVLNQNVPNPFAEQTTITWFIPRTTTGVAQLMFYNGNGIMIKSVDITEKGTGKLNVFANDLSSGIYSYALILDGKIISTKKMDKQ
jgi:hypothetical protein